MKKISLVNLGALSMTIILSSSLMGCALNAKNIETDSKPSASLASYSSEKKDTISGVSVIDDNVQSVYTKITSDKYPPIVVQKGVPVVWTVKANSQDINGCNNKIIINEYGIEKELVSGDNIIEFTPTESGTIPFSCWMGMISSNITVVDDIKNIDENKIEDSNKDMLKSSGSCGGSCCGGK